MDRYESVIILKPTLTEEEINNSINKYENFLEDLSDEVVETENLGIKKLAYEVQGNKEANYVIFNYCAEKEDIIDVEGMFRKDDDVLKFITVRHEPVLDEYELSEENGQLKDELLKKLNNELKDFKSEIKSKGVDYAIDKAYEITVKQEIIDSIQYDQSFSKSKINALLSRKNVLNELYDDWLSFDGNMRETLNYSVDKSVNEINKEYKKEKIKNKKEAR